MPRETAQTKAARLKKIIAGFQKTYPEAHCELTYVDPLQLLIATILSAQCTDKRVNIVTKDLFKKYRSAADFADAPIAELTIPCSARSGAPRTKPTTVRACLDSM